MFLRDKICCPICLGELQYKRAEFSCVHCRHTYQVKENIPILLKPEIFDQSRKSKELDWKRQELEAFDQAASYDELMARPYFVHLKEKIMAELNRVELKGDDVLEVGAGKSIFADRFSHQNIILTDLNFTLLRMNKPGIDKVVADAENLPFREKSFDFVYLFGVIHHLPSQRRGLKELRRIVRPGGEILISEPTKWSANLIYYLIRRFIILIFGKKMVRKFAGCGTPYESFIDIGKVKEMFKSEFDIQVKKILPFRLPPLIFLEKMSWPIKLNKFLEKIPIVRSFGTITLISLKRRKYYGI